MVFENIVSNYYIILNQKWWSFASYVGVERRKVYHVLRIPVKFNTIFE